MRTVYIAEDGTEFIHEFECEDYEWRMEHSNLQWVNVYDEDGNELEDIMSDETYGKSYRVVVHNEYELKDLQEMADYTGLVCYGDIDSIGSWVWEKNNGTFVKETN